MPCVAKNIQSISYYGHNELEITLLVFFDVVVLCRLNSLCSSPDDFLNRVHILVGRLVDLDSPRFDGYLHSVRSEDDNHNKSLRRFQINKEQRKRIFVYFVKYISYLSNLKEYKLKFFFDSFNGCGRILSAEDLQIKFSTPIISISLAHSSGKSSTPFTKTGGGVGEVGGSEEEELERFLLLLDFLTDQPRSAGLLFFPSLIGKPEQERERAIAIA
ncbi:hypothetical protein AGLY_000605, partial [Aphis glycines]